MSRTTEHKEGKATVKVVYYTSKVLADGSHPFMVRIIKDQKPKYISTGQRLLPKYWNEEKSGYREAIRKSYPEPHREQLLTKLIEWEEKYAVAANALADSDQQHDSGDVAVKANEKRKATRSIKLIAYITELVSDMMAAGQSGNASVYRDLGNQLRKFVQATSGAADIAFERVDVVFCNDWENALRASGAEDTTLSNRFRTLKAVLNKAIQAGVSKTDYYPFARNPSEKHKFKVSKFDVTTAKRAITREEVRRLEALEPTTDRHRLAKEVFLFSFFSGGINFVDLAKLRWRNLSNFNDLGQPEMMHYVRQKTNGKFSVPLPAPAAAIIALYRPYTYATADSYIFPILNTATHISAVQIKNRVHKVLGQVNQDLKELGKILDILTPLTTYVARHTMADVMRKNKVDKADISQTLGHKSERVTDIYLDSLASERIKSALNALL